MSLKDFSLETQKMFKFVFDNIPDDKDIYPEYLLRCILDNQQCLAFKVLKELGVLPDLIKVLLLEKSEALIKSKFSKTTSTDRLSPSMKRCLDLALDEHRMLFNNSEPIESFTLLAGIVRNSDLPYHKELNTFISLEALRKLCKNFQPVSANGHSESKKSDLDLDSYGQNLNQKVLEGKIRPAIGRSEELSQLTFALGKAKKRNVMLVGEPGVGKTCIAEDLAYSIVHGNVSKGLKDKIIFNLELSLVVAGTKFRGEFEERMSRIIDTVKQSKGKIILFIDEAHTILGAGNSSEGLDAGNILKPALANGDITVIGATTLEEYRILEKDGAFKRRFNKVVVKEPTVDQTILILKSIRGYFENFHQVYVGDPEIEHTVALCERYVNDRNFPDKAIDLLDETCAKISIVKNDLTKDLKHLFERLTILEGSLEHFKFCQNQKQIILISKEIDLVQKSINAIKSQLGQNKKDLVNLEKTDINSVLESWTGIPISSLEDKDRQNLVHVEEVLNNKVIGQPSAISAVSKALKRFRVGLNDPKRPVGSFIFLGPTGVGKTETCKVLAEYLFGTPKSFIRVDMSEYESSHNVSRLVGSPPGYVGYEKGGQLTEQVRKNPFSIILLDEIEKAHPDVLNMFLQVLEDGVLTDGQGLTVNFKNTIIIMTSNLGVTSLEPNYLGFRTLDSTDSKTLESKKNNMISVLKKSLRPEFINRIDEIVTFNHLTKPDILRIVDIHLARLYNLLNEKNIKIKLTEEFKTFLVEDGYNIDLGARPLRRAVQRNIEDVMSQGLLEGTVTENKSYILDYKNNEISLNEDVVNEEVFG